MLLIVFVSRSFHNSFFSASVIIPWLTFLSNISFWPFIDSIMCSRSSSAYLFFSMNDIMIWISEKYQHVLKALSSSIIPWPVTCPIRSFHHSSLFILNLLFQYCGINSSIFSKSPLGLFFLSLDNNCKNLSLTSRVTFSKFLEKRALFSLKQGKSREILKITL